MNSKPTFQTLQLDCLLEILQYVPLPECMFLRSSCHHLRTAVDEHFQTSVRTLPVLLSANYSSLCLEREELRELIDEMWFSNGPVQNMNYGSTSKALQWELYERRHVFFDEKRYFRRENYLVLFDMVNFDAFIDFITKYLPGITKLALITDHNDQFPYVPRILSLYRKQLKVLLIDRTYRSFLDALARSPINSRKTLTFSNEIYRSINDLEGLEELYFFTKERLNYDENHRGNFDEEKHQFLNSMFRKLRVLHFNFDRGPVNEDQLGHFGPEVFDKLEELVCYSPKNFDQLNASNPQLKKWTFFDSFTMSYELRNLKMLPNLKEIHINDDWAIENFNMLSNLERLHFYFIVQSTEADDHNRILNKTVKIIEIDRVPASYQAMPFTEEAWKENKQFLSESLRYFKALEKVVIHMPFMELTGSDL